MQTTQAKVGWVADLRRVGVAVFITVVVVAAAILLTAISVGQLSRFHLPSANNQENVTQWLALASFQVAMVAFVVLLGRLFGPLAESLGTRPAQGLPRALVVPFVVSVAIMLLYALISMLFFRESVLQDMAIFQKLMAGVPMWLPVIVLVIGAPLSEELVFRGFLLGQLRQTRLGFVGAAIVATAGWALLHWQYSWVGLIDVFIAGMLFSWTLWRTGSVWVPICFHALYNATVLAVMTSVMVQPA